MIRARRLRAENADLRAQLSEARAALRNEKSRAAQAEGERDAYRDSLEREQRRARAYRVLWRGASSARDALAEDSTGERMAPRPRGNTHTSPALNPQVLRELFEERS